MQGKRYLFGILVSLHTSIALCHPGNRPNEHSIQLLENEGRIQRAELTALNIQRNIAVGTVALLTITACFLYRGYRRKRNENSKLLEKQQEINNLLTEKELLLKQKDLLLKEVHHRVKNHLQIIMSLLDTQCYYLEEGVAFDAIHESRNRVQSISLLHQKLYNGTDVSSLYMPSYIRELVGYLRNCSTDRSRSIDFECRIDDVSIDAAQAIPLGLIINEAITNSVKYAFPKGTGTVRILLDKMDADNLRLTISDNGIGMSAAFTESMEKSLGMHMIRVLSRQLGANLLIRNAPGVTIIVSFKNEKPLHPNKPRKNISFTQSRSAS